MGDYRGDFDTLIDATYAAPVGSQWRHVKTGRVYLVTGHVMLEATWEAAVVYAHVEGCGVARAAAEFLDGRFTRC